MCRIYFIWIKLKHWSYLSAMNCNYTFEFILHFLLLLFLHFIIIIIIIITVIRSSFYDVAPDNVFGDMLAVHNIFWRFRDAIHF